MKTMSEPKKFLERWSRRKRELADESCAAPGSAPENEEGQDKQVEAAAYPDTCASKDTTSKPFSLADLPAIESIDAKTDIRAFLQAGVPAELKRAALRRAWSTDPEIRDFIGLVENGWDFNDPNSIPGFGTFAVGEDITRLLKQVIGEPEPQREEPPDQPPELAALSSGQPVPVERSDESFNDQAQPRPELENVDDSIKQRSRVDTASQNKIEHAGDSPSTVRRRQGGALPK
jgi:hypothetical protein